MLVHNGLTTLEVLVIGLSAVSMFGVLLTGLCTYTIHAAIATQRQPVADRRRPRSDRSPNDCS
ncbi:hypothetical protein NKI15_22325 [Mesorhizobium sp. M0862]|uniref:hypothetical protein n=1 Tax=Mesorhizobium sp. M0862 TaxID=2957015 RepID=UPI00333D54A0